MKKTNDYDGNAEKIARLLRSGGDKAQMLVEKPAMLKLLPNLEGKDVLNVGCGTGEACGELLQHGAKVSGFDLSQESVKLAKEAFPEADLQVMDMHDLSAYDDDRFDFIYSSLTLYYSEKPGDVLTQIHRVLRKGGLAQFSVVHPLKWAAEGHRDAQDGSKKSFLMGYDTFETPVRVYGDYLNITCVTQKPPNYIDITYWNRPISDYFHLIREANFDLINFVEPKPTAETEMLDPDYWAIHSKIPQIMIFVMQKR